MYIITMCISMMIIPMKIKTYFSQLNIILYQLGFTTFCIFQSLIFVLKRYITVYFSEIH